MKLTPLIAASVLALSLSPAVQAQRGSYPSAPYTRWDAQRTYDLAREVDQTASRIRRQAERYNRRPDRREARMLDALRQLDVTASQFRRGVESYRRDYRQSQDNFFSLLQAFDEASDALRWMGPRSNVDRGMERISGLLTDLAPYYGRNYRWGYHGHDRYGHDDHDGRYDGHRPPHR